VSFVTPDVVIKVIAINLMPYNHLRRFTAESLDFESAQLLVTARGSVRRFTHALQNPLPALFDMDVGVAALAGKRAVRWNDQ
jgi:hypothetical protein